MRKILGREFFERYTPQVARDLLGKFLVRKVGSKEKAYLITEVEAYTGRSDMSSHARMGPTPRNKVMFGPAGRWYVYFIYGMYNCVNIVTEREGVAGAVLIRGVQGIAGPGKLCRELKIPLDLYGQPSKKKSGLWIEDRGFRIRDKKLRIKRTPRINVSGGEKFMQRPWRFVLISSHKVLRRKQG